MPFCVNRLFVYRKSETTNSIVVKLPDGNNITSLHTVLLNWNILLKEAGRENLFKELKNSLISIIDSDIIFRLLKL